MRAILIILSFIPLLNGCVHNKSIQEKFNDLERIDYSDFNDLSIINRKGVYFVTYHGASFKIKKKFLTEKISSIERTINKNRNVLLTKKDTIYFERALNSFDKIDILSLSVDEKRNVFLSVPWHDRCTYKFLRLSPLNTLEDIKKQYYTIYKDDWYLDKECSER